MDNHHHIIQKTVTYVQQELANAESGHDWWHTYRVWQLSKHINNVEKADPLIIELGALLHDIAESKFYHGDESIGPKKAYKFLHSQKQPEEIINHVVNIVTYISFKGGNFTQPFHSQELDIVQDADRLDAMGAIGIARTFNYGGFNSQPLYDPNIQPKLNLTKEEYKRHKAPTINHFYEKLLLLKDRMNTQTGKQLAVKRHKFMEKFLEQFDREWNCEVKIYK